MMAAGESDAGRIDWAGLAAAAAGHLGWTPETFWSSTPAELSAALARRFPAAARALPMGRAEMATLAARFPDA